MDPSWGHEPAGHTTVLDGDAFTELERWLSEPWVQPAGLLRLTLVSPCRRCGWDHEATFTIFPTTLHSPDARAECAAGGIARILVNESS